MTPRSAKQSRGRGSYKRSHQQRTWTLPALDCVLRLREADADAAWDRSFAASEDWLARMEAQVLKDYHEGRTDELDPDAL